MFYNLIVSPQLFLIFEYEIYHNYVYKKLIYLFSQKNGLQIIRREVSKLL